MPPRKKPPEADTPVDQLWNLSRVTAAWLADEGIASYADLQQTDLIGLWMNLRLKHPQVTRLMYYALWGAVNNAHWRAIPDAEKERLNEAIASFAGAPAP